MAVTTLLTLLLERAYALSYDVKDGQAPAVVLVSLLEADTITFHDYASHEMNLRLALSWCAARKAGTEQWKIAL